MNNHYEIRVIAPSGNYSFHAELTCPDDEAPWRFWSEQCFGIMKGTRQMVITALANLIGTEKAFKIILHSPTQGNVDYLPDRLGNVWHNDKYLSPNEYLPAMFAEAENVNSQTTALK